MEADSSGEDEPCTEKKDMENESSKLPQVEIDPRGFHELAFLGEASSEVECEIEEREVGPEFDSYEDAAGDKLRLLDSFSIYYEDGRPAPPQALDSAKERGETFVAFGTLVAPLTNDARMKLIALDLRFKGRIPPCVPKSLDGGAQEPLPWVAAASWSKGASAGPKKLKSRGKGKRPAEEGSLSGPSEQSGDGDPEAADGGPVQDSNKRVCTGDVRKDIQGVSPRQSEENGTGTQPAAVGKGRTNGSTPGGKPSSASGGSGKKRKAPAVGKGVTEIDQKKPKPPPNFSLAAFSGALDGSEGQGVPSSEYIGSSFRRGREDGLLLYYADKAPRDYPLEYESKVAGAASLDWSKMEKNVKVDAFCMETFKWYGAKVAEVSEDRKRVKVHFNGWKSSFDEWMDWESFRLAPCGSRSSAKREGGQAASPAKKDVNTRCVLVPARHTVRIRIEKLEDWCTDYSDPCRPVLWIISKTAWYKVAGYGWWDFVAPHPLYAPIFEPSRMGFVVACLVVRALQASPLASFAAIGRRVFQLSSGMFEGHHIIEHHEVVTPTIEGMGILSTKKKPENGEGSGAEDSNGGMCPAPNGDGAPDSIDAKDTLFLKELRIKAEEWEANGRSFIRRVPERHALPPPPGPTLPALGTDKAIADERPFPNPLPGDNGSGSDDWRYSGGSGSGSAHGVTPVGSGGSPRSIDGGSKAKGGGGGSKAGGAGPKSNGGGRRAGGRGPKAGSGGSKTGFGGPKTGGGSLEPSGPKTGDGNLEPSGGSLKPSTGSLEPSGGSLKPSGESLKPSEESLKPSGGSLKPSEESLKPSGGSLKPSGESLKPSGGNLKPSSRAPKARSGDLKTGSGAPKADRGNVKPISGGSKGADGKAKTGGGPRSGVGGTKAGGRGTKAGAGRSKLSVGSFEPYDGDPMASATFPRSSTAVPEASSAAFKSFSEVHKPRASTTMHSAGVTKPSVGVPKAGGGAYKARRGISKAGSEGLKPVVGGPKAGRKGPKPLDGSFKPGSKGPKLGSGGLMTSGGDLKSAVEGLKGISGDLKTISGASKGGVGDCKIDGRDSKSGGGRLSKVGGSASKARGGVPKARGGAFTKGGRKDPPAGIEKAESIFGSPPHVFGSPLSAVGSTSSGFESSTTGAATSSVGVESPPGSFETLQAENSGGSKAVGVLAKPSKKVRPGPTPQERLEMRQKEQREKAEKAEQARTEKAEKQAQAAREKQEKEERLRQEREEEKTRKMKEKQERAKRLQEEKARLNAEKQAERRANVEQRMEKQRLLNEEKARIRQEKEREKEAKMEKKRLEKEARDRQRAELQAKEQKRRELEKEKARLAKRYPLPDEELWEEEHQLGKAQGPWPAAGALPIPQGFPMNAFGDAVNAWSSLQLFGTLMHLKRFSLYELMSAVAHGADASDSTLALAGSAAGGAGANNGSSWSESCQVSSSDPDALLDIIPAPVAFTSPAADNAAKAGSRPDASMLANIHMRLLDFLAWDRTRALTCSRQGKQDMYWKGLLLSLGGGSGSGSGNGESGGGGMFGEDDEFGGVPETTLPGLRDSRELIQASPHGFPELLRLVESYRHGVFRRVEPRRTAAARGFAGLASGREEGGDSLGARPMQARALDPLGEVMRILRYVMRSEDARPFLEKPPDTDVDQEEAASKDGMGGGRSTGEDGVKKELERSRPNQPLDLGTILKRVETGWYDLEPGCQPPAGSKSFGAGHAGVAHDVELIQEGWLNLRGGESAIYEQARKVVDAFLSLYQVHVLLPLERSKARVASGCGQLDPMEMLRKMECSEYARWSPAEKSRALAMLCDEAMSSTTLSDVARKIFEAREVVDRKDRELKAAVRQRLREQETRDAQGLQPPTSLNRRGTEAEMVAARIAAEEPHMRITRQLGMLRVRLKPLGTDRNRRRYWLLAQGEDHRIFTELNEEWGCYARVSQLKALHKWLDRRGVRERVLKAAIREHLITNLGVPAEDLDPPSRPPGGRLRIDLDGRMGSGDCIQDDQDDDQQYIGEPAEVAREKERERAAGREALKSCGFFADEQRSLLQRQCSAFVLDLPSLRASGLAFELKSSVMVMRDIAVCMGHYGLGLQLKIDHGGVAVSGHKALPVGGNPGEEAGVMADDVIVSVDSIVAMAPRALADGLSDSGLSRSGKLVVLKVLTRVPRTDERGEPLASAMGFSAVNVVKVCHLYWADDHPRWAAAVCRCEAFGARSGELLEGEMKLHHRFVIGTDWGGQTCRDWRLGVSFAGQGIGQAWGHGASLSAEGTTSSCCRMGGWEGAVPFPSGKGPSLKKQGALELGPNTEEDVRHAVEELGRRMLQLEAMVFKQDTVVDARWGEKGRRRKWRMYVNNAQTAAQLLTAWGAFKESIDWKAASGCFSEMDRRDFIGLLPTHSRNTMPDKGDSVVYFGDGHAISVEAETKAGHKSAWGNDPPRPGEIKQFGVKSISYHQGGSHRRAKGAQPFATMELEPLPEPRSFPELGMLPTSEPFGPLNRLLKRSIKAMRETPDVAHFLEPVNKTIYPDYYDVISHPMDLSKLWRRCSVCRYKTVENFKHDLELVASNCRLYCQDKFPSLPPAAEASVKVGMATLDEPKLASALVEAIEDGKRLEEVWNKHMLAAISASPELATMPGMRKLARQLGVFTAGGDKGEGEMEDDESDSENEDGQPDTAKIARQVFYDKLVGVEYGTSGAGKPSYTRPPRHDERNPLIEQQIPQQIKKSAIKCESSSPAATIPSERQHQLHGAVTKMEASCSGSEGPAPMEIAMQDEPPGGKIPALLTPFKAPAASPDSASMDVDFANAVPDSTAIVKSGETDCVATRAAVEASRCVADVETSGGVEDGACVAVGGGVLRVSVRLNSEMPEFVVATSKYEEAVRAEWRSEMHIQMAFTEEQGDPARVYEGKLVGVKPKDESTGMMPWECLVVEWDDETNVNTANPWQVEPVSDATAAARRRGLVGQA